MAEDAKTEKKNTKLIAGIIAALVIVAGVAVAIFLVNRGRVIDDNFFKSDDTKYVLTQDYGLNGCLLHQEAQSPLLLLQWQEKLLSGYRLHLLRGYILSERSFASLPQSLCGICLQGKHLLYQNHPPDSQWKFLPHLQHEVRHLRRLLLIQHVLLHILLKILW